MPEVLFAFLASAFSLFLSLSVFRARPGDFLNHALSMGFFFGFWIAVSFSHLLLVDPSPFFVSNMYRFCYFLVILDTGFFLLFSLGFLKGPGNLTVHVPVATILALALLNLTGLTLWKATYHAAVYAQENGPLYVVFVLAKRFWAEGPSSVCS